MGVPSYEDISTEAAFSPGNVCQQYSGTYIESGVANDTIPFGYACQIKAGVIENLAAADLTAMAADNAMRIAMYGANASALNSGAYSQYDQIGLGATGFFSVVTEEDVAVGDPVRVRLTTSTVKIKGMFGTTADPNKTAVINEARYVSYRDNVAVVFIPDSITFTLDT